MMGSKGLDRGYELFFEVGALGYYQMLMDHA